MSSSLNCISFFNQLKGIYTQKQDNLKQLKQKVTNGSGLDQMQRSQLRIQIESLLIDINEEIYAISEEISKVFLISTQYSQNQENQKVQEFQKRQQILMQRVDEMEGHPHIHKIRGADYSPPQKDGDYYMPVRQSPGKRMKSSPSREDGSMSRSPPARYAAESPDNYPKFEVKMLSRQNSQAASIETFGQESDRHFTQAPTPSEPESSSSSPKPLPPRFPVAADKPVDHIPKPKKSTALRRHNSSQQSLSKNNIGKKDHRQTPQAMNKQFLSDRKAINKAYTKSRQSIPRNAQNMHETEKSEPINITFKQQIAEMKENLYNQKQSFEQIKLTTTGSEERPVKETNITKQKKEREKTSKNKQPETFIMPPNHSEMALMKKLIHSFQQKLQSQDDKIIELSNQVTKLARVNLKLNADNKVIRDEHAKMQHQIYNVEKKQSEMRTENIEQKVKIDKLQTKKSHEVDMPRQIEVGPRKIHQRPDSRADTTENKTYSEKNAFNQALEQKRENETSSQLRNYKSKEVITEVDQILAGQKMREDQKIFKMKSEEARNTFVSENSEADLENRIKPQNSQASEFSQHQFSRRFDTNLDLAENEGLSSWVLEKMAKKQKK